MVNILIACCLTIIFSLCIESSCIDFNKKSECLSKKSDVYRFYGTKTTYTVARKSTRNDSVSYEFPDCEPIMFYLIGRHAIRYPDAEDITKMSEVLPRMQKKILSAAQNGLTELCEQDLQLIREWKLRMNETDDNRISDSGLLETKSIAKDFITRYPSLFDTNKVKIEVGVTNKIRTTQTAEAFVQEIESNQKINNNNRDSSEESEEKSDEDGSDGKQNTIKMTTNNFLYFHDTCEELLSLQGVELVKPKIVKDFRGSDSMKALINRVNQRLGLQTGDEIDAKVLKHVIRACYFEFAIHGNSPWCAALGEDEFKQLEYLDDIEDYYEDAYGRDINAKQTCPLISDLLEKVKESVKDDNNKRTYLQFTHAGVMKRLYSGLGLFDVLHSSKTLDSICLSNDREWKSSLVSPFGANIAIILYKCKNNSKRNDRKDNKYKILTLVQENPVVIQGCDSALCTYDKFKHNYKKIVKNCDLNTICRI